jgi:hypothetical protein
MQSRSVLSSAASSWVLIEVLMGGHSSFSGSAVHS